MAHTYSIDRVSTTTQAVNVPYLTQANFRLISTVHDPANGIVESRYSIPTGDPTYPTIIVVRYAKNPKDKTGASRTLTAINTFARDVDGTGALEDVVKPISASTSIVMPSMTLEAADISALLGNLYSLTFNSLTAQVPDTAVVSDLMFGLTEVF